MSRNPYEQREDERAREDDDYARQQARERADRQSDHAPAVVVGDAGTPVGDMEVIGRDMMQPNRGWDKQDGYGLLADAVITDDGRAAVALYVSSVRHAAFLRPAEARHAAERLVQMADAAEAEEVRRGTA